MIDSHVHLDAKVYSEGSGLVEILHEARKVGVERMVAPSLHFDSFERLLSLSTAFPIISPAVGVHPHEATAALEEDLAERLAAGLAKLEVPILGETGLEGHYDFTSLDVQMRCLRPHLEVAKAHGVPAIFHCRSCEELLYEELKAAALPRPGVVHCFTGSWEWAQRFLDLGYSIGITGIVTFKNSGEVAEVATKVPLDRLLVETDGPYLAPIPYRGRTNKPQYIPLIVEAIAKLRGVESGLIGETTAAPTEKLFGLRELSSG